MKYIVAFGLCLSLMSWNASVALADPGCNAKTIKGAYGTSASGTITGLDGSHFPLAELGLFTLDGVGNLTGSDTVSIDGNVFPRTFTGTYTVNADCTATVVLTDEFGNVGTTSGVIVDHGDSTLLISVNPGDTITGHSQKIK